MNNKFQQRSVKKNNISENFNLNRGMDIYLKNNNPKNLQNLEVLNDRDMFFHFSNENEQISMSSLKPDDSMGLRMFNPQISNNKKNLLNKPFIQEINDKTHFKALNTMKNLNSSVYANFNEDNNSNNSNGSENAGFSFDKFTGFDKINNDTHLIKNEGFLQIKTFDNVEKNIVIYEYTTQMQKEKKFVMDIITPFGLSFLWKSILLLTKNPSTDKLLKLLQINKKDEIMNDMKYYSDIFNNFGTIEYNIPYSSGLLNSNFTKQIYDIYKIKVNSLDNSQQFDNQQTSNALINFIFNFELKIPYYYQPVIITDFLLNFNNNKIKFIKLSNVPYALEIDKKLNIVNLEVPMSDNVVLGFIYNIDRKNIADTSDLYEKIIKKRNFDKVVNEFYFPKINRNKKINYGQKFNDELKDIHFGEIIYGNMYDVNINTIINLDLTVENNAKCEKYQIVSSIQEIKINHNCYFYIKNNNIENKIIISGIIEY